MSYRRLHRTYSSGTECQIQTVGYILQEKKKSEKNPAIPFWKLFRRNYLCLIVHLLLIANYLSELPVCVLCKRKFPKFNCWDFGGCNTFDKWFFFPQLLSYIQTSVNRSVCGRWKCLCVCVGTVEMNVMEQKNGSTEMGKETVDGLCRVSQKDDI